MDTHLPRDQRDLPIPCLKFSPDGAHHIPVTASSARNATAFQPTTRVVSIYSTGPIYIRQGDATVVAAETDHYFPANTYYDISIGSDESKDFCSHLAVLRADADCTLHISEKS